MECRQGWLFSVLALREGGVGIEQPTAQGPYKGPGAQTQVSESQAPGGEERDWGL